MPADGVPKITLTLLFTSEILLKSSMFYRLIYSSLTLSPTSSHRPKVPKHLIPRVFPISANVISNRVLRKMELICLFGTPIKEIRKFIEESKMQFSFRCLLHRELRRSILHLDHNLWHFRPKSLSTLKCIYNEDQFLPSNSSLSKSELLKRLWIPLSLYSSFKAQCYRIFKVT